MTRYQIDKKIFQMSKILKFYKIIYNYSLSGEIKLIIQKELSRYP